MDHTCKECGGSFPIDAFYVSSSGYVKKKCKKCYNEYQKFRRNGITTEKMKKEKEEKRIEKRDGKYLDCLLNLERSLDRMIIKNVTLDSIDGEKMENFTQRVENIKEKLNKVIKKEKV
jgi:hypothetical protein